MTPRWLASSVDQALIRLWLRPTLPTLSPSSPLAQLRLAEQRTTPTPSDDRLFPALSVSGLSTTQFKRSRDGLTRLTRLSPMPIVPIESEWFPRAVPSRSMRSRWYVRQEPRPLLVAVGGWQPVRGAAEHLWPIQRLDRAGFDVVISEMAVLPAPTARERATFPSSDPSRNVIELARFACCIQQVLLVAKSLGHDKVLIWGTSLGAHVVSLLATIEQPTIADSYILEKPLLQMSDPIRLHGRGPASIRRDVALRLDRVYRAVSPIQRKPHIDSDRVHVIGALCDRVTPASGAECLANHFGAKYHTVQGSHIYDLGRFKRTVDLLTSLTHAVARTKAGR